MTPTERTKGRERLLAGVVPGELIKERLLDPGKEPGADNPVLSYVPGWWYIEQVNRYWPAADFQIIEQQLVQGSIILLGSLHLHEGSSIRKLTGPVRGGVGGAKIIGGDARNAYKRARTDLFKNCCHAFGIAGTLYRNDPDDGDAPIIFPSEQGGFSTAGV